jgi:hypothetical protein
MEQRLVDVAATSQTVLPVEWRVVLVTFFAAAQRFALLVAWRRAQERPLTDLHLRAVSFLCDVPVYLGLLGSLVGVSLTQFFTGSLAAPLAYLTTISGILLHLFGKYTIWLPLPQTKAPQSEIE